MNNELSGLQWTILGFSTLYFLSEGHQWLKWHTMTDWQMRFLGILYLVIVVCTVQWDTITAYVEKF